MSLPNITSVEFGAMTLNPVTQNYEGQIDLPGLTSASISIEAKEFDAGRKRVHAFLTWMKLNHQEFKLSVEQGIQDYDLVWDDVWNSILGEDWVDAEDGFLSEYLRYESVDFNSGALHVWIDTSGLHTDHKIRVTVNDAMQIALCEML
jgi:hypothetical protein